MMLVRIRDEFLGEIKCRVNEDLIKENIYDIHTF